MNSSGNAAVAVEHMRAINLGEDGINLLADASKKCSRIEEGVADFDRSR